MGEGESGTSVGGREPGNKFEGLAGRRRLREQAFVVAMEGVECEMNTSAVLMTCLESTWRQRLSKKAS